MALAGAAILVVLSHIASWGGDALPILSLKTSYMTGLISTEGLERLIEVCERRSRWECVDGAYRSLSNKKPRDPEVLNRFGKLQIRLEQYDKAAAAYRGYFAHGGTDAKAMYSYAKALEESGPAEWYSKAIDAADPRLLPVNATRGLFGLLVRQQKYEKARAVLQRFLEMGGNAKNYMAQELDEYCVHHSSDRLCLVGVN
jgi:tetratricopeptide (TPR) repeat protein